MLKSMMPCPICNQIGFHTSYSGSEGERMKKTGECFTCAFWSIRADQGCELVVDNFVYSIGHEPTDPNHPPRGETYGMAGRRFDIEFTTGPLTGKRCTTHNLWAGGEIPKPFRARLPNTAVFVGAERVEVGDTTCWNPSDQRSERYPSYAQLRVAAGQPPRRR
jgi:hypothetical protein